MKKIGVLILAHAGVQNPQIWIEWSLIDPRYPIKLFALCEQGDDVICSNGGIKNVTLQASTWCSETIATNTLAAMKAICKQHSDIAIIYLVSGYCLPICHPSQLYKEQVVLPRGHVDEYKVWNPMKNTITVVKRHRDDIIECTQWISLIPATILAIQPDKRLLKVIEQKQYCPDEMYIQTLVHRLSLCDATHGYQNIAFMDICRAQHSSRSPIEWSVGDNHRKQIEWTSRSYSSMNTDEFVKFAVEAGYSFIRKIKRVPQSRIRQLRLPWRSEFK